MQEQSGSDVTASSVHEVIGRHMQVTGFDLVLDLEESQGCYLRDKRRDRTFVDFFGFYASNPLGMNHPKLVNAPEFRTRLTNAALNKVTNTDIYTEEMGRFVDTFSRVAIPDYLPHAFFISGGALAVENALKAAFDWKVRKNFQKGYREEKGHRVLYFDQAFHGRTGYTLSLTDPFDKRKTKYFPRFEWPKVLNPVANGARSKKELARVREEEDRAVRQIKRYFQQYEDEIAAIILEPIQGEGGDNHFRPAFLQQLRTLADENEALLVFDEVQTGVGLTGAFWAHQNWDVKPDILAFGKKTQVCGILASERLDEVENNVFEEASRLNSTWGGNLVDMVRFDRILEVIEEDELVAQAGITGRYLQDELEELSTDFEEVTRPRGEGLLCAFDVPSTEFRKQLLEICYEKGLMLIGCGSRTIRFRPPLIISEDVIDEGMVILRKALDEAI